MKSILRHLNPFHFETWYLLPIYYMCLIMCLFMALGCLSMTFSLYPRIRAAAMEPDMPQEALAKIENPGFKDFVLSTQENERDFLTKVSKFVLSLAFMEGGLVILFFVIAFYLKKAHSLLSKYEAEAAQALHELRGVGGD